MSTSKNHLVVGVACAMTILPVIPPVVSIGDFGIALVRSVGAQTTEWDDGAGGPDWDADANWDNGVPDSSKDATHTSTQTDIEVNTTGAECKSFKGKSGSVDRFLIILEDKVLTILNDLFKTTGIGQPTSNFVLKMEDGSGVSDARTKLDVSGNVTDVDVVPTGGAGDWLEIIVDGDVIDSAVTVGDNSLVTFGDTSTDEVRGGVMSFGTVSATDECDATTVTINGSAGTEANPVDEDWSLFGYAAVTIEGNFIMTEQEDPPITLPLVEQTENASLTVKGDVIGGDWHVLDDSLFTHIATS